MLRRRASELVEALEHACARIGEQGGSRSRRSPNPRPGTAELSPRQAFLAAQEVVASDHAQGGRGGVLSA